MGPQATLTIKERSQTVRASVDEEGEGINKDVIVPYLQSMRAALEAQTICLLKQSDEISQLLAELGTPPERIAETVRPILQTVERDYRTAFAHAVAPQKVEVLHHNVF